MLEVAQAPGNLCALIAGRGKRQDGMVVGLSHRVADSIARQVFAIGLDDALVYIFVRVLQPCSQCWAEVEVDGVKVAHFSVWTVTFRGNLFIEVGEWSSGGFNWNMAGKWVIARGLVKMSVQAQVGCAYLLLFVCLF